MSTKIGNLNAATAEEGDEIPANRSGSDVKLTAGDIASLGPNSYGGMYVYDGATAQAITNTTTPVKLTCFSLAGGVNGLSHNCTPDKVNNRITVARAGTYYLSYSLSFLSSVASINFESYVYVDGTIIPSTGSMSKMAAGAGTDMKCINGGGFAAIAANKDVDLRAYHSHGSSVDMTVSHANLTVRYVGT